MRNFVFRRAVEKKPNKSNKRNFYYLVQARDRLGRFEGLIIVKTIHKPLKFFPTINGLLPVEYRRLENKEGIKLVEQFITSNFCYILK